MRRGLVIALLAAGAAGTACRAQPARSSPDYRVYVTNEMSGDLSVIDGSSHKVTRVPLGKRPRGLHASPDGRTLYVALSGSPMAPPGVDPDTLPPADKSADGIGVVDISSLRLVRVLPAGSDPEEFDLSRDGKHLYVSNEDAGAASIVDAAAGTVLRTLPIGGEPEGVTTSPDGRFVYVTNEDDGTVSVIDTGTQAVAATIEVGRRPRDVAFLPDGRKAYVTCENDGVVRVVDPVTHAAGSRIELGPAGEIKPMAVVLSPDAARAYVSTGRGRRVFVLDAASDRVVTSFDVGERPWGIGVSPDGRRLYAANGPSNDVAVVDIAAGAVTARIPVGERPWGVLILPR